jgi:tetratricopeptide (TPR) repeat protein
MTDDPRVEQLLDELLDSDASPEEVCAHCPELLTVVRSRWRQVCQARDDLDILFPPADESGGGPPLTDTSLPNIPGYEVEEVIGLGGMGVVFRARHLRLNRVVALKMALAGAFAGPRERERFRREAEAVAALRHPNVVQIHDTGDADGRPFLSMEYVDGGSLAQKVNGTPLPARDAAALVATVAGAVEAAHRAGIVHRDLKPANVLLTAAGVPKVSDFGLARRVGDAAGLTRTGTAVGTPSYMAPEQAGEGKAVVGPSADVYALGVILYELLTGGPPFRAARADVTLYQVLTRDPDPPSRRNPRVPRDLETVCLKCLQKEPRLRYPSAAALAEDLNRFLNGEAITARPEGWLRSWVRRVRRRPVLSAAVAVAALSMLALIGVGAWTYSDRETAKRAAAVELAVVERAVNDDLAETEGALRRSAWPQARAALERARGRLGDRELGDTRERVARAAHHLAFADRLDAIRVGLADGHDGLDGVRYDTAYEEAFRDAGLGHVHDDPAAVAARILATHTPDAVVAALDHWSSVAQGEARKKWVLDVARLSDAGPDPTGWRGRARAHDLRIRPDQTALADLVDSAPVNESAVSLLLAVAGEMSHDHPWKLAFVRRVQRDHPDDYWANFYLGYVLLFQKRPVEATRFLQAAVAIRPAAAVGHHTLAAALLQRSNDPASETAAESLAHFRRAAELAPTLVGPRHSLANVLHGFRQHAEALGHAEWVLRRDPHSFLMHSIAGRCLEGLGRSDEAEAAHRQAVRHGPRNLTCQTGLREFLLRRGRTGEARGAWRTALDLDPPEHDALYGYAELCLFLGEADDYRAARTALLERFDKTTDPTTAERTARACLLLPAADDKEFNQAVALAGRAAAVDRTKAGGSYPYFQFVRGLAEYREGQFEKAVVTLRGDAARMPGPAPRLVLAMALHKNGQEAEARKTFALAVSAYDWRMNQATDHDGWIRHALRREAERMILPNLPAFLSGKHQPADNDERLGLIGACQVANHTLAVARLYADAFAADPKLADDFRAGRRGIAAVSAALAGYGRGEDAGLDGTERAKWRIQAREWLRVDLAAWEKAIKADPAAHRDAARQSVGQWANDPDLARVRTPDLLEQLPAGERKEWAAFWGDVDAVLKQTASERGFDSKPPPPAGRR